jgi:apolipoprotein N-acyltransferase
VIDVILVLAYIVGSAFLVDAETFGWMLPFAVTLLPAGLAVFIGVGFVAARLLWTPGRLRVLTLAATLSSAEWLRGHVFTGFPWNAFGYALTTPLPLAESVAIFGIWGLTFVAVAVFATPAVLADGGRRPLMPVILAGATLATLAAYGGLRLASHPTETVDGVHLRIMQPNIPQDEDSVTPPRRRYDRYVSMSQRTRRGGAPSSASGGESRHQDLPPSQAGEGRVGTWRVTCLLFDLARIGISVLSDAQLMRSP